jgi:hypothetical protein
MTAARFNLRQGSIYTVRYRDLLGHHHEMTATYLGDHKFGGTSWSFRPMSGVKNLAPMTIVSADLREPDTTPEQPHRLERTSR